MRRLLFRPMLCAILTAGAAVPASAQLLGERVVDQQRLCVYLSDRIILPASQPCPATAPFRDPNRPVPGNAALARESTEDGRRRCVYTQGGVEYTREIPLDQRCAMTPDLLARATARP
jgi:hypothetical protein